MEIPIKAKNPIIQRNIPHPKLDVGVDLVNFSGGIFNLCHFQ